MKNRKQADVAPILFKTLTRAVSYLKKRMQRNYERAYPDLGNIVEFVINTEEAEAWQLSPFFPHLVLPVLVEGHMAQLGLQLLSDRPKNVLARSAFVAINPTQAVEQLCEH